MNKRCASSDCVVGTQKKGTEITLKDVAEERTSKSAHVTIKHDSESEMSVVQLLKDYSEARHQTEFSRNFYSCKICFQVTSLF